MKFKINLAGKLTLKMFAHVKKCHWVLNDQQVFRNNSCFLSASLPCHPSPHLLPQVVPACQVRLFLGVSNCSNLLAWPYCLCSCKVPWLQTHDAGLLCPADWLYTFEWLVPTQVGQSTTCGLYITYVMALQTGRWSEAFVDFFSFEKKKTMVL